MSFENLGLHEAPSRAPGCRCRLRQRHRRPAARHSARARRGRDLMVSARHRQRQDRLLHPAGAARRAGRARRQHQAPREGRGLRPAHAGAGADARTGDAGRRAADTYGRHVQGSARGVTWWRRAVPAQIKRLRGPLDILVATPGRLLDHPEPAGSVSTCPSRCWCSTKPTACSTWASSTTSPPSPTTPAARQTVMSAPPSPATSAAWRKQPAARPGRSAIDVASHTDTHANIEQRLHWADNAHHKKRACSTTS